MGYFGKLGMVIEGAGKRRLFAIGNHIKQRLCYPYHKWLMQILRRLPTDGTFDQTRPLDRLVGCSAAYSFDLKSATDRWPLPVMFALVSLLLGPTTASSFVQAALSYNTFVVERPNVRRERSLVFYAGQPLGMYGSWPLFTLSHHFVVWMAAERAYPGQRVIFRDYAVLGDDVVITDPLVAQHYRALLDQLGVTISHQKSVVSDSGCLEFAKRFRVKGGRVDISPYSHKLARMAYSPFGLAALNEKSSGRRFSTIAIIGGAGYKVTGSIPRLNRERIRFMCLRGSQKGMPLEYWMCRGLPCNPYLRGAILYFVRQRLKPKELKVIPEDLLTQGELEILERTMVRRWMAQWLKAVQYYSGTVLRDDVTWDELFACPVVETNWRIQQRDDIEYKRFG